MEGSHLPIDMNKNIKRLIILRSLPGGGKSTLAAALVEKAEAQNQTAVVCNCDEYFMVKGEYKFDGSKLGLYHGKCLAKARKADRKSTRLNSSH